MKLYLRDAGRDEIELLIDRLAELAIETVQLTVRQRIADIIDQLPLAIDEESMVTVNVPVGVTGLTVAAILGVIKKEKDTT